MQERAASTNKALDKSEPLKNEKCGRNDCFPCETDGGKCEKNGAGYEIVCVTCQRAGRKTCYYGETGFQSLERILTHVEESTGLPAGWKMKRECVVQTLSVGTWLDASRVFNESGWEVFKLFGEASE